MNIQGNYKIKIYKDDGVYIADISLPDGNEVASQGKTEKEIFEMIADNLLSIYEIKIVFWKRWLSKLI